MKFKFFAFLLFFGAFNINAKTPGVLITVGMDKGDSHFAKEACDLIYQSINLSVSNSVDSKCIWLQENEMVNKDVQKELRENSFLFHIDYRVKWNGDKVLRVVNLDRQDDTDTIQSSWIVESKDQEYREKIAKLIKQSFETKQNLEIIKLSLLANGIKESNEVDLTNKGQFIDKATGEEITGQEAYNRFKEEKPRNKHYLRTGVELASILGFAAINYEIKKVEMARDWDYPSLAESWSVKGKSTKGYRFDDNSHGVNEGHAYAGMIYYMVARSNGFTSLESALINLASSSTWEFLVEYREVVSINDQILTPLGGFAIGEAFHQIAKIFSKNKNKKNYVDRTLATMFDSPTALNGWIDRHYKKGDKKAMEEDFDADFWSKVDIETSVVNNSDHGGKKDVRASFDAQIINISGFEETGKIKTFKTDTVFSEIMYSIPVNQKTAMEDFRFTVKNVLAAYYSKDLSLDNKERLQGYSFIVGPSHGVDFYETNSKINKSTKEDWMSVVNVLGSTMRLDMFAGGFKISCTVDLFGDFAMVRSYSIDQYKEANPSVALSSVIQQNNYYYGLGTTKALTLNISKDKLDFGVKYQDHSYTSINSRYRDGETIDQNLKYEDSKKTAEVYVSYKLTKNLSAKLSYERTDRTGGIEGFGVYEGVTTRKVGTLLYKFR